MATRNERTRNDGVFTVDLTGLPLTSGQRTSIALTIQGVVLTYLAANVNLHGGKILTDLELFNGMKFDPPSPPARKRTATRSGE